MCVFLRIRHKFLFELLFFFFKMIYFNKGEGLPGLVMPDKYEAVTIGDFVQSVEKNSIPIPSLLKILSPWACFEGFSVIIVFNNIYLENKPENYYNLFDLNHEMDVGAPHRVAGKSVINKQISDGWYEEVSVLYDPQKKSLHFIILFNFLVLEMKKYL